MINFLRKSCTLHVKQVIYILRQGDNSFITPVLYNWQCIIVLTHFITFALYVADNVDPVISCPNNIVREVRAGNANGETVTWTDATATDNSGVVQSVLLTSNAQRRSGTFFVFGSYTITYTATDGSGNSASCSFTVTVGEFLG